MSVTFSSTSVPAAWSSSEASCRAEPAARDSSQLPQCRSPDSSCSRGTQVLVNAHRRNYSPSLFKSTGETRASESSGPLSSRPGGSQEGVGSFLQGAVAGSFAKNYSWSAIIGQTVVGFIPVVGQIADARDLAAALNDVRRGREGAWTDVVLAGIGLVPGLDFLKGGAKVGRRVLGGGKASARAALGAKAATRTADGAREATRIAEGAALSGVPATGASAAARGARERSTLGVSTVDAMRHGKVGDGRRVGGRSGFAQSPPLRRAELRDLERGLNAIGIGLVRRADASLPPHTRAGFVYTEASGDVYLRRGATRYEAFHETMHARQYRALGYERYVALGRFEREAHVFRNIWLNRHSFTYEEIRHAIGYMRDVRRGEPGGQVGLPHQFRELIEKGLQK